MIFCPVCSTAGNSPFWKKGTMVTLRCNQCGLVFQDPGRRKAISYNKSYYEAWGLESCGTVSSAAQKSKEKTFGKKCRDISRYAPPPGRILDVGCANGSFLKTARSAGWDPYGIEINPFAVKLAAAQFPGRITEGTLETASFDATLFDIVTMFDVLEHIADPKAALTRIAGLLKRSGLLVLVTPDGESCSARVFKTRWMNFKEEHYIYFTRKSIAFALEQAGFTVVEIRPNVKWLNLAYIHAQSMVFRYGILRALHYLMKILPGPLKKMTFPLFTGELLVFARKK